MFDLIRLDDDSNIFMIVKKDDMAANFFTDLPVTIYGFLKVDGQSYITSTVSHKCIANDVSSEALHELIEQALLVYWQID